jgi:hypothetical protein
MHDACNAKDWVKVFKFANEIEAQAKQLKHNLGQNK